MDALFGSNLFLHYTIAVDYRRQRVTFSSPSDATLPSGSPIALQLIDNDGYAEVTLQGDDGKRISALFLVDSGTTAAMILNRKFLDAHPGFMAQNQFVEAPTVTAVGGAVHSKRVRVPAVDLGPFSFSQVVATVPEASVGAFSNASVAGFLGAEILERFTVTWDYAGKRMFLSPNSTLTDPFDTDASGLHLISPGPDYRAVMVDSVLHGSPAEEAGLKPEDVIVAVDGVRNMPVWKVSKVFRQAGTSVALTIQRKGIPLKIVLHLRSPFSQTS